MCSLLLLYFTQGSCKQMLKSKKRTTKDQLECRESIILSYRTHPSPGGTEKLNSSDITWQVYLSARMFKTAICLQQPSLQKLNKVISGRGWIWCLWPHCCFTPDTFNIGLCSFVSFKGVTVCPKSAWREEGTNRRPPNMLLFSHLYTPTVHFCYQMRSCGLVATLRIQRKVAR